MSRNFGSQNVLPAVARKKSISTFENLSNYWRISLRLPAKGDDITMDDSLFQRRALKREKN